MITEDSKHKELFQNILLTCHIFASVQFINTLSIYDMHRVTPLQFKSVWHKQTIFLCKKGTLNNEMIKLEQRETHEEYSEHNKYTRLYTTQRIKKTASSF